MVTKLGWRPTGVFGGQKENEIDVRVAQDSLSSIPVPHYASFVAAFRVSSRFPNQLVHQILNSNRMSCQVMGDDLHRSLFSIMAILSGADFFAVF